MYIVCGCVLLVCVQSLPEIFTQLPNSLSLYDGESHAVHTCRLWFQFLIYFLQF